MFLSSWPWSNGWWWTPVLSTTIMKHVCLLSFLNLCEDNMFSVPAHLDETNRLHQVSLRVPNMLGFKDHLLKGVAHKWMCFQPLKMTDTVGIVCKLPAPHAKCWLVVRESSWNNRAWDNWWLCKPLYKLTRAIAGKTKIPLKFNLGLGWSMVSITWLLWYQRLPCWLKILFTQATDHSGPFSVGASAFEILLAGPEKRTANNCSGMLGRTCCKKGGIKVNQPTKPTKKLGSLVSNLWICGLESTVPTQDAIGANIESFM